MFRGLQDLSKDCVEVLMVSMSFPQSRAYSHDIQTPVEFAAEFVATEDVDVERQPTIEIRTNPPEWKYVERILPMKIVPTPLAKDEYPSGWVPQQARAHSYPYFIRRSKNHMVPVYLDLGFRNIRKRTIIRHIEGDIWLLYHDLFDHVSHYMARKQKARVNEFAGQIVFAGDHVNLIKDYLVSKGF